MTAAEDAILVDIEDGIATVTFNQPHVRNALTRDLRPQFAAKICPLEHDPSVRCVVLSGAGDHFMAGGDINLMKERIAEEPEARRRTVMEGIHSLHHTLFALRRMPKPVIASVRGAAAGFGLGLVGACDMAIAADDAIFTLAYCHIGASPDGGSSYFLARTLGMKQQFELAFLGDRFGADRAKDLGLINFVVPTADLEAETKKLARRLADGPTHAYGNAKALFNAAHHLQMEAHLQMEGERIADSMTTKDHEEGVAAFLEKRKPKFVGH